MKITRGHYNRKILTFGVMIFLAIALISTGFAAWIMSSGAETGFEDGNLTVGTITESNLNFTEIAISDGSTAISFEPALDDNSGDIKWDGENAESLTFTLTTTVSPSRYLDEIQVSFTFPDSVVAAHQAGYIVLPDSALLEENKVLTIVKMNDGEPTVTQHNGLEITAVKNQTDNASLDITIKVTIGWGEVFGNINPSIYLDKTSMTSEQKKDLLYTFKKTVYALSETMSREEVGSYNTPLKYSMKLIATVN